MDHLEDTAIVLIFVLLAGALVGFCSRYQHQRRETSKPHVILDCSHDCAEIEVLP